MPKAVSFKISFRPLAEWDYPVTGTNKRCMPGSLWVTVPLLAENR